MPIKFWKKLHFCSTNLLTILFGSYSSSCNIVVPEISKIIIISVFCPISFRLIWQCWSHAATLLNLLSCWSGTHINHHVILKTPKKFYFNPMRLKSNKEKWRTCLFLSLSSSTTPPTSLELARQRTIVGSRILSCKERITTWWGWWYGFYWLKSRVWQLCTIPPLSIKSMVGSHHHTATFISNVDHPTQNLP